VAVRFVPRYLRALGIGFVFILPRVKAIRGSLPEGAPRFQHAPRFSERRACPR